MSRSNWIDVDLNGLSKLLNRRGKEFAIYEHVQNSWDDDITEVRIELTWSKGGISTLTLGTTHRTVSAISQTPIRCTPRATRRRTLAHISDSE
jgi:hypothetical protein